MLLRRTPFSLPYPDQVPELAAVVCGKAGAPRTPQRFLEAAAYHNVSGIVLGAVQAGRISLTDAAHRTLADGHLRRVARTSLLRAELEPVVPTVRAACSVAPVIVKGPALGERFYDAWQERPYADLDLMVPVERLADAVLALRETGFAVVEEFRPGYAERFGHDVHVSRQAGAVPVDVELHWRIGDDPVGSPLGHAHLLDAAEHLEVGPTSVLVPSVPDQLLLLSVHLLSDRARRLAWVNDIRLVAKAANDGEWTTAFETAGAMGGGLLWVLHRALDYAAHHLGLDRPRTLPAGPPPRFGPLRAVEELDLQAAPHVGRLVVLRGAERLAYLRAVAVPTRAGLEGTVGGDGAGLPTLVARHLGRTFRGVMRPLD